MYCSLITVSSQHGFSQRRLMSSNSDKSDDPNNNQSSNDQSATPSKTDEKVLEVEDTKTQEKPVERKVSVSSRRSEAKSKLNDLLQTMIKVCECNFEYTKHAAYSS